MITSMLVALATMMAPEGHIEWSRARFASAARRIRRGDSESRVIHLLGKPDDIQHSSDRPGSMFAAKEDIWRYGTAGHNTLATLCEIQFTDRRVTFGAPWVAPPNMPEPTFRRDLRELGALGPKFDQNSGGFPINLLNLIRAANRLQSLGKKAAVEVLVEYMGRSEWYEDQWLLALTRVLFIGSGPKGVFKPWLMLTMPENPGQWPNYPVFTVHGIPFAVWPDLNGGYGYCEPLAGYTLRCSKDWTLRSGQITPPDDPFLAWPTVARSSKWKLIARYNNMTTLELSYEPEVQDTVRREVMDLARSALSARAYSEDFHRAPSIANFESYHQEFLRLGGHWDKNLQMYVRRDGTHL